MSSSSSSVDSFKSAMQSDLPSSQANGERQPGQTPTANTSSSPSDQILTGKQEHCSFAFLSRCGGVFSTYCCVADLLGRTDLKRELIGHQVRSEINELNSPTALKRFGAPFGSDFGEVAPVDSELPILRYIFVHHVRNFPFLDQAHEKEFWQDKLQVVGGTFLARKRARLTRMGSFWNPSPTSMYRHQKTDWKRQSGGS